VEHDIWRTGKRKMVWTEELLEEGYRKSLSVALIMSLYEACGTASDTASKIQPLPRFSMEIAGDKGEARSRDHCAVCHTS